jgi:hypothetical protein
MYRFFFGINTRACGRLWCHKIVINIYNQKKQEYK